jgi:Tfp pilus assembly protein PilO
MLRTTTPVLSLLTAILMFVFFTQPFYEKTLSMDTEIAEYHEATKTYKNFLTKLEEKVAVKNARSAYEIERLNTLIPETIDETQYLVDIEALAKKQNLLFGNISISENKLVSSKVTKDKEKEKEDVQATELGTVDISFDVVGTYEQFKDFLKEMETSLTIFEVTHMALEAVEGPFQQFSVTVRVYALSNK